MSSTSRRVAIVTEDADGHDCADDDADDQTLAE
jgi:hypothetical protein